ncbi:MAG: methyltransferase [Prevotella sp.]|nr:methyltransferase [Prevotella sp.]
MFHFKQFDIRQDHAAMKVGTDSDLLGALAEGGERILDIGTGTGVLALMMAQRFPKANITAIDIDADAILDASYNFSHSPFADRLTLHHCSLKDFVKVRVKVNLFDSILCNPPYFDKSLEAPDKGRARARHTSSLPFSELIESAYELLQDDGIFSVILPPEVLPTFSAHALITGFWLKHCYKIKTVPSKDPKRYILIYQKGRTDSQEETVCLRNADNTFSDWHNRLLAEFLTC